MAYSSDPFSSAMMSLPTPPGTSHREEKENRSSFSFSFQSTSRVAWSEHNEYHTLVSPLSPIKVPIIEPSVRKRPPAKSILKKTTAPLLPSIQENEREQTPEPTDPMIDLHYLEGPVSRIIAADASLRDLIESYSILAARLRSCIMGNPRSVDATWPLFQPLRANREDFVDAVVRDLGRALEDPWKHVVSPEPEPEVELALALEENERSQYVKGLPSPKDSPKKKRGMSEEQVKHARDLVTTCHAVLKLLATMFVLPGPQEMFTDEELGRMLTQILAIPMADSLPTPNARKTFALTIWFIQVQRLPEEVLHVAKDRIAYALRRGIEGELGKEGKKGSISDGLKAVHELSVSYPKTFIPAFTALLPSVFHCLLAPTLSLRSLACHALGGFAFGSASLPISVMHTRIANFVVDYILTPIPGSPSKRSILPNDDPFIIRTLRTTLQEPEPQHAPQGPVWALCVLASLVALLRGTVFHDLKVARCLAALFSLAMRQKKSSVRALMCLVWRTMTWAYFQPPPMKLPPDEDESQVDELEDSQDEGAREREERKRATDVWKIICSVTDMGSGTATIGALLDPSRPEDDDHSSLRLALTVLRIMSKKGGPTCGDALDLVSHLLSLGNSNNSDTNAGEAEEVREWNPMKLLVPTLFSCSPGLLTANHKFLASAVKPMFKLAPQVEDVRWLNAEELSLDWVVKGLIDTWREGLRALRLYWGCTELPDEIRDIWTRLITAKVHLASESGDEEAPSQVAELAVDILIDLLEDELLDLRPSADNEGDNFIAIPCSPKKSLKSPSKPGQPLFSRMRPALTLFLVHQLWLIAKEIIPESSLMEAAGRLLKYMTSKETDILGRTVVDEVHEFYATLCSSVAVVCDISDLEAFWTFGRAAGGDWRKRPEWPLDAKAVIWCQFLNKWEDDKSSWEAGGVLLRAPFRAGCSWEMTGTHLSQWDMLLRRTMDRALDYGVDSFSVLDHVASSIVSQKAGNIASLIRIADLLLSHLDISEARQTPEDMFELVNSVLLRSYPPPSNDLVPSMWLLRSVTRTIDTCPVGISQELFEKVQDGLSVWISDEYGVLPAEDYSFNILPLYQTLLLGIQTLPKSMDVLETFAPVIHSAFVGSSSKPSGLVEAFQEFWQLSGYSDIADDADMPEKIALCLELVNGPPEPITTQDITDMDDTVESVSDHMDVDEVEMHLTQTPLEEEDIGMCLSPDIQEITKEAFMLPPVPFIQPKSPAKPVMTPKPPSTPKITSPYFTTSQSRNSIEPYPVPNPIFSIVPSSSTLPGPPHTPKRSPPKSSTTGPASNKENRSPLPAIASIPERTKTVSPGLPVASTSTQGILGKRRSMGDIEEEEVLLRRRSQSSVGSTSKSRPAKGFRKSLGSLPSEDDITSNARPIKALFPEPKPFPKLPEVKGASTPERLSVTKSRKRKSVFLEAVELPTHRSVRRRTESLPEPRSSSPSASEDTPKPPVCLRRTRSATRLLGKGATFEKLQNTPRKNTPRTKKRSSGLVQSGSSSTASSMTSSNSFGSSPLRKLGESVVAGSDDSIMLATPSRRSPPSDAPSSDDLPFLGVVTPRRLVSPAMRRIHENTDCDPPSDDSVLTASPSRERVARRSGYNGSTPAPSLFTHPSSTAKTRTRASPLKASIKRKSISSLFGIDGETLSY